MQIPVISVGDIPESFLEEMVTRLNGHFNKLRFVFQGRMGIPDGAFNSFRDQYKAERILDQLRDRGVIVAITDKDIYAGDLNYVFGETEYRGPGVVSIKRLKPEFYDGKSDSGLLMERLVKEVVHEVGHCFGLKHCEDPECAMKYSNSIKAVDRKERGYCDECQVKISTNGLQLD